MQALIYHSTHPKLIPNRSQTVMEEPVLREPDSAFNDQCFQNFAEERNLASGKLNLASGKLNSASGKLNFASGKLKFSPKQNYASTGR